VVEVCVFAALAAAVRRRSLVVREDARAHLMVRGIMPIFLTMSRLAD